MKDNKEKISNTPTTAEQSKLKPKENKEKAFPVHPDTHSSGAGGMVSPD
ncbi:hypothetical protein [Bacillus thermotolerans]|uniref:Uncharacterized protein n=1 Tax=Bacillus thermotolerans TaxID=1221996 RepID=A0A0F5HLP4_BACTR|nr:hypothetical protein [Bacillus thermotolerans]KKB34206.1 hypothetical protein QY97_02607 [Bacillus thermotolerans]KKB36818.1 hypothetical protein QY96_03391 [Bacillus thermotolerans]KKB39091.1 hypothetical protein QY95_02531 [Bacillus thermotolerans]